MIQQVLTWFSDLILPLVVTGIVLGGLLSGKDCYQAFVIGAKKGLRTAVDILPTLIGLMIAVGILRASGVFEDLARVLKNGIGLLGFPVELIPLILVRMFSASAATGVLLDLFEQYGTDSRIGTIASILMSCSETIFYTMSIYFMSVKVKKSRWTLAGALVSMGAGICASLWLGSM